MNHKKSFFHHLRLTALCLLAGVLLSGCGAGEPVKQEAVRELQCTRPTALATIRAVSDGRIAVSSPDYETGCTTLQIVDVKADTVCREIAMEGVWDLKEQAFSDGRITLCNRETKAWAFRRGS